MKKNRNHLNIIGWILFVISFGLFSFQMGYLFISEKYQVEYIDNRLFYIINILCIFLLTLAIVFQIKLTKKMKVIGASLVVIFIGVHLFMLVTSNQAVKNITSISPDWKHVLSIKEHVESGEAMYYRDYYGILARAKERLPFETKGEFQVKWLANDIAAVTYEAKDNTVQQFIGTYGDRGSGRSYYYVGAEIHGRWQGENIHVVSDTEGISVTKDGKTELFEWSDIQQFGTLAVVLKKNNEAVWTISLNENFEVHSDASESTVGNITIYEATMEKNKPITLHYSEEPEGQVPRPNKN
ncbi:hypothetical protein [Oceanobacillus sp. Castelsardo]|uniref:hypothetical protein n=1 Tax=Oceanobacillus sp. Castelsardo TaxID=1851204 RepID=UPI00083919A7|nr:hypothetical protein [Oceanobacillus sp. Castelsardo]